MIQTQAGRRAFDLSFATTAESIKSGIYMYVVARRGAVIRGTVRFEGRTCGPTASIGDDD
jgi:hypothetical protein